MTQEKLTRNQFVAICQELLIDPGVALESDTVTEVLKESCTAEELRKVLAEEF